MGGGSWSDIDYRRSKKGRKAFVYSDDTLSKPKSEQRPHQLLDPYGLRIRESRDSAEHPESNAVVGGLDVTGSMARVVVDIQSSLGTLMDMLLQGEYIPHPQLLFYAVGDATCDYVPFQVSQFESDIRINDQITKVVLEGGGGGQLTESYELGFYVAAYHTSIDCFEKRKRKGYFFTIGDEMPYPNVSKAEVQKIFGETLQEDIPLDSVAKKTQETYHTFHIVPKGSAHYDDPRIINTWARLLGGNQFVFILKDPSAVAETIALAIGLNEGTVSFEDGLKIIAKKSGQSKADAVQSALTEFAEFTKDKPKPKRLSSKKREDADKSPKKEKPDWKI